MCTRRRIRPRPHSPSPWLRCSLGRPPRSEDDEDELVLLRRTMKIEEAQVALLCRERIFAVAAALFLSHFRSLLLLSPLPLPIWHSPPPRPSLLCASLRGSLGAGGRSFAIQGDFPLNSGRQSPGSTPLWAGRGKETRRALLPAPPAPPSSSQEFGWGGGGGSWAPLEVRPPEEKIWALEGDSSTEVPGVRRLRPSLPLPEGEVASS